MLHLLFEKAFKNKDTNPYRTLEQAVSYNKAIFLTLKDIGKKYGAVNDDYLKYFGSNKFFANELINSLEISCICEKPYFSKLLTSSTSMVLSENSLQIELLPKGATLDHIELLPSGLATLDHIITSIESLQLSPYIMDQNVELLPSYEFESLLSLNDLHFVSDGEHTKFNALMSSIELFNAEKGNDQEVQENIKFKKHYTKEYSTFFDIEEQYNYFEYRNKYITEGYSLEDKKQCPVEIANEFQQFLCVFKIYGDLDINSEAIASFFEMSIYSNVEVIFPNLYRYYQEEILPAKETYYLANTNQCPNDNYNDMVELLCIHQND